MLTFGTSVSINNLQALRSFHTFLFNYQMHEHPSFIEKWFLPKLKTWVEERAIATMSELLVSEDAKSASVSLNDVSSEMFCVLYIVQNPQLITEIRTGKDLFMLMANMNLEFVKIQRPKNPTDYAQS